MPTGIDRSVAAAVERDLKKLPPDLASSALAIGALAVARVMDDFETEPSEMASCFRTLQSALDRLRDLAPEGEELDGIDQLAAKRAARLAGSAAT